MSATRLIDQEDISGCISSGDESDTIDSVSDIDADYAAAGESSEEDSDFEDNLPLTNLINRPQAPAAAPALVPVAQDFVRDRDLNPTNIPFTGQPGVKVRHTQGLTP